ncbi:MAG: glycosyltransferase family 4 protein [Gammaproteobacteria bacterium]|nr:glycosyltransferase family 4 protein [Gammaproteobacteria bacterium]
MEITTNEKSIIIVARWPVGGIRTYLTYVYTQKEFYDYRLTLITPSQNLKDYFKNVFLNCNFFYIETGISTAAWVFKIIARLIKKRPNLLHSHGLTAGLVCAIPAKILRIPHILTLHDVFLPGTFNDGVLSRIKYKIINVLLKFPTIVNPCGYDAADNFNATFPYQGTNRVLPIRNGIDVGKFSNSSIRNLKAELNCDDETWLIGFFGRFMRQKGFDLLVTTIKSWTRDFPDKPIHVVCFGWGAFIREEQQKLNDLKLSNHFSFLDQTNDMASALRGVDITVMPSRWEACPLLPMEAMVCGTPVISSDCIGMKEVCNAGTPVISFRSENQLDLFNKLQFAYENRKKIRKDAEAFKYQAVERFDVKMTAKHLSKIFSEVLSP